MGADIVEKERKAGIVSLPVDQFDESPAGDEFRLEQLRQHSLAKERLGSDPEERWKTDLVWLKQANNQLSDPDEIGRMWMAEGLEVADG